MSAVTPMHPACHLELRLLEPGDVCPQCQWPAHAHRNHISHVVADVPEATSEPKKPSEPKAFDVLDVALLIRGRAQQMRKAVEECSELCVALMHHLDGRASDDEVATEIADVLIMAEQMRRIFGRMRVDAEVERKRVRLQAQLEEIQRVANALVPVIVDSAKSRAEVVHGDR